MSWSYYWCGSVIGAGFSDKDIPDNLTGGNPAKVDSLN
jgi:acetyltransferase-like isoleucine patch superfamily enzyme